MYNKLAFLITFTILVCAACTEDVTTTPQSDIPVVQDESSFTVLTDLDVTYADGLKHEGMSPTTETTPLLLDIYYPDNNATNRPVCMFIHGGGFTGGTKQKPEIVEMGNYYASRGWVYISIDYRTTEETGMIQGLTMEEFINLYKGMAPQEWIDYTIQNAEAPDEVLRSVALYAAQRDAKAALRWVVANAEDYSINTDYITVGGASAGAVTTLALGISDLDDFRDEISSSDDPTLVTTNLDESYDVKSMIYFWGSNAKLELFEAVYGIDPYDSNDPELFMAHGTRDINPSTPFSEATEMKDIYDSLGIHNELVTLEGAGHGAWDATVDGKGLFELTVDFIVDRQNLIVE